MGELFSISVNGSLRPLVWNGKSAWDRHEAESIVDDFLDSFPDLDLEIVNNS